MIRRIALGLGLVAMGLVLLVVVLVFWWYACMSQAYETMKRAARRETR